MGAWREQRSEAVPRSWPCQNRARCGHIFPLCNQRLKSKFSSEMLVPASFKTPRRPNKTHLRATSGPPTASVPPPAELPSSPSVQFLRYLWREGGQSRNGMKIPNSPLLVPRHLSPLRVPLSGKSSPVSSILQDEPPAGRTSVCECSLPAGRPSTCVQLPPPRPLAQPPLQLSSSHHRLLLPSGRAATLSGL